MRQTSIIASRSNKHYDPQTAQSVYHPTCLTKSPKKIESVCLLNPWRFSITKVLYRLHGTSTAILIAEVSRTKMMVWYISESIHMPDLAAMPVAILQNKGRRDKPITDSSSKTSKIPLQKPNHLGNKTKQFHTFSYVELKSAQAWAHPFWATPFRLISDYWLRHKTTYC